MSSGHHCAYIGPSGSSIISGDRYLAYMIASLRMRKYQVVLMSPSGTHPSLTSQASVNLDWTTADTTGTNDGGKRPSLHPCHPLPSPHQCPFVAGRSSNADEDEGSYFHYPKPNFLSKAHTRRQFPDSD